MDLNENIRVAAEVYSKHGENKHYRDLEVGFIDGAKSQAAKDYWYNEFKQEKASKSIEGFLEYFGPSPLEPTHHQGFFDGFDQDEEGREVLRRIGMVDHGPKMMICGGAGRSRGKLHALEQAILEAKERGIIIVGAGDLELDTIQKAVEAINDSSLKGASEIHEFTRRPEIVMPIINTHEDFEVHSSYFDNKETSKPWDRKNFPNKMNNYKSKKRRK